MRSSWTYEEGYTEYLVLLEPKQRQLSWILEDSAALYEEHPYAASGGSRTQSFESFLRRGPFYFCPAEVAAEIREAIMSCTPPPEAGS